MPLEQQSLCACMVMMDLPSDAPVFVPVSVIGHEFIGPDSLELIVEKRSKGKLVITDINHKILLKVKPCDNTRFHEQLVLLDTNDRPVVMLREKMMTEHNRWNVFRGESKEDSDMIFSTKTPHMFQFRAHVIHVNVSLANKKSSKDECDFKIKGSSWSKKDFAIYIGDSSTAIAQVHAMDQPLENEKFVKDKFKVAIHPNVDYAFVVALIAIVDAMNSSDTKGEVPGGFSKVISEAMPEVVDAIFK